MPTSAKPGVSPAREHPARLHALPSPPASRGKPSFVPLPAIGTRGRGKARAGRGQGCVAAGRMFGRALSIPCSTRTPGRGHGAGVPALNTTTQSCSAGSPRNLTKLRTVLPILGAQGVGGGNTASRFLPGGIFKQRRRPCVKLGHLQRDAAACTHKPPPWGLIAHCHHPGIWDSSRQASPLFRSPHLLLLHPPSPYSPDMPECSIQTPSTPSEPPPCSATQPTAMAAA